MHYHVERIIHFWTQMVTHSIRCKGHFFALGEFQQKLWDSLQRGALGLTQGFVTSFPESSAG